MVGNRDAQKESEAACKEKNGAGCRERERAGTIIKD
jgi:hypothetical protein